MDVPADEGGKKMAPVRETEETHIEKKIAAREIEEDPSGWNREEVKNEERRVVEAMYSFLINGVPIFTPHQGLRQDDPISPYLFLLCAEGLSTLNSQSVAQGNWRGLQVCDGAPMISHLLFADDSMLYANASPLEIVL
ncbi:hypothetical protein ACLB2K_057070 [Fragaria x ananassa]